jgi:rhodanese-related sulfurtransferase
VQYLDARDRAMFDAGHAPGAVHVPADEWDKAARAAEIGFDKTSYWDEVFRVTRYRSFCTCRDLR